MSNYRKLIAGIVGVAMILLKHFTGVELPGLGDALAEVLMAVGTWVAVWWFPNTPPAAAAAAAAAANAATAGGRPVEAAVRAGVEAVAERVRARRDR